jgi:hypothetical protein
MSKYTWNLRCRKGRSDAWHDGRRNHYWIEETIPIEKTGMKYIDGLTHVNNVVAWLPISEFVSEKKTAEYARLIAAAPKMYQFIKDMAKGWECGTPGCCIDSPCCEVMEARALLAEIGLEEET